MRRQQSLGIQAITLAIGLGFAQLLVAVLFIVTARMIGPDAFGPVASAITLGIVGAGLMDLGATQYWIRESASDRLTQGELNSRASTRLYIVSIIAAAEIAVAGWLAPQFVATGVMLFTTSLSITVLVPLRAACKADYVGWLTLLGRGASVVAFFGLLSVEIAPSVSLWSSLAFGDLLRVVFTYIATPASMQVRLRTRLLSNPWRGARWYLMIFLASNSRQLDLPIVGFLAGPSAAGIYGGVNRWTQPLMLATSAFSSAAAPYFAKELHIRNLRRPLLRATPMLAIPLILCVWLIFEADWLVSLLLGDAYAGSVSVLKWLAGAMILNVLVQPMLTALQARRFDHFAAAISMASVGAQLAIVVTLAPTMGALSAGIAFFASQALQLLGVIACVAAILWRRNVSVISYLRD